MPSHQILEGIKILDWTQWAFGPMASVLLSQLGADVIKVESLEGDRSRLIRRTLGTDVRLSNGSTVHFECSNFNKRSIAVDLKTPEGKAIIYRLVKSCDVFLHNFRLGVPEKLGLGYADLKKHNPKLIYAGGNGFGTKGPDADVRTYNISGVARSALMYTPHGEGDNAAPIMLGIGLGDLAGAQSLAFGILAALVARERFGIGQQIDASQLGACMVLHQFGIALNTFTGFKVPSQSREGVTLPLWNYYKCKDNSWVVFTHLEPDRHWSDFCHALGIEYLEKDPKFSTMMPREANSKELIDIIDKVMATKTFVEWEKSFKKYDLLYTRVNRTGDLVNDAQVVANEYIVDFDHPELGKVKQLGCAVKFSKTPGVAVSRRAPKLGEHTDEVLETLGGYSEQQIARLRKKNIVR